MSHDAARYVYGVVGAGATLPAVHGIDDARLELVPEGPVAAIVSAVPSGELRMGREAMSVHARVVQEAHELETVLPLQFGVVMANRAAVADELLRPHSGDLTTQLSDFTGTVELKVRAVYDEDSLLREVL